jgi:hypothetical protein
MVEYKEVIKKEYTGEHDLDKVILYGAGTQNLRMAYQPLVSAGYDVLAICDKDLQKQGTFFYGKEIISPERLAKLDEEMTSYLLVITTRTPEVVQEVRNALVGLKNAMVFSFDEFISYAKLNSRLVRFSCLMVHLVDDCNLNCVRCSHFSPLATKGGFYLDEVEFEQDCAKLSELTRGDVDEFQLSGGEPMMHPKAEIFPYIIRKYFPKTQIIMITNGTFISKMKEEFLKSCKENHLKLMITRYPINLPYGQIEEELKKKQIDFEFGNTGNTINNEQAKVMWGLPLVLEGRLSGRYNFDGCLCMQYILRGGRLYPCANSAYIDLFKDYFNLNLPGPEVNGVDFRNAKSLEEVTSAISCPVPLCDYCDARKRMSGIPWSTSKKEMSEWIFGEEEMPETMEMKNYD